MTEYTQLPFQNMYICPVCGSQLHWMVDMFWCRYCTWDEDKPWPREEEE